MENLQDLLLKHVVPDQVGQVGKITYSFTEMKIIHVHWPRVSNADGLFVANNGALILQGKYAIQRPGVLGYNKSGEFIFDLSAICLSIRDNTPVDEQPSRGPDRHRHHEPHHRVCAQDVTCTVGHIKVKFHGGAAKVCQFLTSMYIKIYKRHLESQISRIIQETLQDDGHLLLSALSVMASLSSHSEADLTHTTTASTRSHHQAELTNTSIRSHHQAQSNSSGQDNHNPGKIQLFLDSFKRKS